MEQTIEGQLTIDCGDIVVEDQGWIGIYTLVVPSLSMKFIKNSH